MSDIFVIFVYKINDIIYGFKEVKQRTRKSCKI